MIGIKKINVRFFMFDPTWGMSEEEEGYIECDEISFLDAEGVIEYVHHTVFDNGVKQICLTKNPFI